MGEGGLGGNPVREAFNFFRGEGVIKVRDNEEDDEFGRWYRGEGVNGISSAFNFFNDSFNDISGIDRRSCIFRSIKER